jgi:MFS family permease
MMTGGGFGALIGGQVFNLVGPYGWRYVFFVGLAPALLLLLIRRGMEEPLHFRDVRERRATIRAAGVASAADERDFMRFVPAQLFGRQLRFNTVVGVLFCLGTLLAIWTSNIWLPTIQSLMLEKEGITGPAAIRYVGNGMTLYGLGGILGYASFGFLADFLGRRPTVVLYNVGTLASGLMLYLGLDTYTYYPYLLPVFGYFVFGVFSGHAVYLPELFPTHVRATAVVLLQRLGPHHHQLRPARGGAPGRAVRQLQPRRRGDDRLCGAQYRRHGAGPRDQGRPIAALTTQGETFLPVSMP